jgi:hypothetical protein
VNGNDGRSGEAARPTRLARWRPAMAGAAVMLGLAVIGAIVGLSVGLATRTHAEIAGSHVTLRLIPGQHYDEVNLAGALAGKRASTRSVLGEPIGIRATVDVDATYLFRPDGSVNSDVLPAYLQSFSDPDQVVSDLRRALVHHLAWFALGGAISGALIGAAAVGYRRWRIRYDLVHDPSARSTARRYRAPERRFVRRALIGLAVLALLDTVPGAVRGDPPAQVITADPILADTPLAGTELTGLLRPAIAAADSYVHTYFADTDDYYRGLRDRLRRELEVTPVALPEGPDVVHFGFVTDRHCNIGMDRVIIELLDHFAVPTLVSGGDDDFSGSFPFESACTSDLAEKSKAAGVTDVFAAGNHDSAQTLTDERARGVRVLDGEVISIGDLHFIGSPDPRTSRYGQGIEPASSADQAALLEAQAARIARAACAQDEPLIIVLHDPRAGRQALENGCGKAVLALDGHTHVQRGPDPVPLTDTSVGHQFVGGSSGGAPTENSIERSFASALTVGPLNHEATVNLVSYNRVSHRLVGVTVFHFQPDQRISVEQLPA